MNRVGRANIVKQRVGGSATLCLNRRCLMPRSSGSSGGFAYTCPMDREFALPSAGASLARFPSHRTRSLEPLR